MKVVIESMGIVQFYDCVAMEMGHTDISELSYDCRKIDVAPNISDLIFEHYKQEGYGLDEIGMMWVCYGPKVDTELKDFEVVVKDGFITKQEDHDETQG